MGGKLKEIALGLSFFRINFLFVTIPLKSPEYIIIISLLVFTISIIAIAISNRKKRIKNNILSSNIDILNKQLEYQYSHYKNIKEYQDEVRRLWHDMKHHINLINLLLENGEYDECKKYTAIMAKKIEDKRSIAITKHSILDAILTNKMKMCEIEKIKINMDIRVSENIKIDNFDLCIIYKNLMDNAIEACCLIDDFEKRFIKVKSLMQGNYLYLEVINSKRNDIIKINKKFVSQKEDKQIHGYGIESVKRSVFKYDGQIKFEYDEETFKVTALIKNEIKH